MSQIPDAAERRREDYPLARPVPLRWADIDTYGHVNNAVHYYLMDTAINVWLIEASGVDVRMLPAIGVVVETGCRYFREVQISDRMELGVRLEGTGRSSVRYEVAFFVDDGPPAAIARFVHVYIDQETRRPVDVPAEIWEALAQLA